MKIKLLPLLFLVLPVFTTAQNSDSLKKIYNSQLLYHMGSSYMLGQEKIRLPDMRNQFAMSPEGLGLYQKGMRQYNTSRIITAGSMAFTLAALASINRNTNNTYWFLGGQLLTGIIGAQLRQSAQKFFDRAIWRRNKDLLFGAGY